jgi:cob(I)alamin adenosyltransferase
MLLPMRLYTKTGDDGTTGLFGGERVPKNHPRVVAYGDADALNAHLGLAVAALDAGTACMRDCLMHLQRGCFDLGADLATPPSGPHEDKVRRLTPGDVSLLEGHIDAFDGENTPLTEFILPGGCEVASRLHVARTVARACERSMLTLRDTDGGVSDAAVQWINRCSDLLFAMARAANRLAGQPDVPWQGKGV